MNLLYKTTLSLILMGTAFLGGWYSRGRLETAPVRIAQGKILYNTIDYSTVPQEQQVSALSCYGTSVPELSIRHEGDDDYLMKAGLCDRKWSRPVKITREQYRHIITGGMIYQYFDNRFHTGAVASYTRLCGSLGVGGGVIITDSSIGATAHISYMIK